MKTFVNKEIVPVWAYVSQENGVDIANCYVYSENDWQSLTKKGGNL